jgi:precorrin-6A/cobalt-precorrin-6A reductase
VEAAASALGSTPARVFLSIGRQELAAFTVAPQHHYIARTIDPPDVALPPDTRLVHDRGPFDAATEEAFLAGERIDVVVSKNSGGVASYPKIAASRRLQIPVVMIARPHKPAGTVLDGADAAVRWLEARVAHGAGSSRRGV